MPPALVFVIYLLALIAFTLAGVVWPLAKHRLTELHLVAIGLALVTVVWVVQAGQATF